MPLMIEDLVSRYNLFAFHQQSHADSVLWNGRVFRTVNCFRILSVHIPACPTKFLSTLNLDENTALNTMTIELELPPDRFKIYCE